jgi:hypothetical protein
MLTRYLYNLVEVKHSLFLSILRHQEKETLFWICEIFYSGFEEGLEELLINMYENCYFDDKIIKEYLRTFKKKIKSKNQTIRVCSFATLAVTMCYHNFNLKNFLKIYFDKEITQGVYENKNYKESLVEIKKENLKPFIETKTKKLWQFLQKACVYQINKEYTELFKVDCLSYQDAKHNLFNKWLYLCKDTPLWIDRINEHEGVCYGDSEEISFNDEDKLEEFYQKYGYEPDEQPVKTIENILGNPNTKSKNIDDFCKEFCLETVDVENTIKLNPLLNIKDSYFKLKSLEVLKEWFARTNNDNFDIDKENNITICYSNQIEFDVPICNINKKSIWKLSWDKIDDLLYMKWYKNFNSISEEEQKNIKYLDNAEYCIDLVVCLNNKTLIGIDIVYNDYPDVAPEKINALKKYKVNNYYQVKAEWILSNYGPQDNIECKKLL